MQELKAFRRTCYSVAGQTGGRVAEFRVADGVTPNFHQGVIDYRERSVAVVLARDTEVVAVAEPRAVVGPMQDAGALTFVDFPELIDALIEDGKFTVLTADELSGPFNAAQWPELSDYDIRVWKPATLGEALFNYWD